MDLIKIARDNEKAKSIIKMVSLIEERIKTQDKDKLAALIVADYYEVIKELITALLLTEGYKTLSHKDLIDYLKNYKEFNHFELAILDDLRVLRNRITYDGFFVESSYLKRNEENIKKIIDKLKGLLNKKLNFKEMNKKVKNEENIKNNNQIKLVLYAAISILTIFIFSLTYSLILTGDVSYASNNTNVTEQFRSEFKKESVHIYGLKSTI